MLDDDEIITFSKFLNAVDYDNKKSGDRRSLGY